MGFARAAPPSGRRTTPRSSCRPSIWSGPTAGIIFGAAASRLRSRDARGRASVTAGALEGVGEPDQRGLAPSAAKEGQPDRLTLGGVPSGDDDARVARP